MTSAVPHSGMKRKATEELDILRPKKKQKTETDTRIVQLCALLIQTMVLTVAQNQNYRGNTTQQNNK